MIEDAFPDHIELVGTRINDSCKLILLVIMIKLVILSIVKIQCY